MVSSGIRQGRVEGGKKGEGISKTMNPSGKQS